MTKISSTGREYDIIRAPLVTEKSTGGIEQNKYSFTVAADADKPSIKKAIERLFNVKVTAVNIINVKGKEKRFKGIIGRRADKKKAIVTLAEGQTIDVAAGV